MKSCVINPDKATIAKPIETKKYKSSGFFIITSFTYNEEVKTIQAFAIHKKEAIIKEGKTLLSENLSLSLSS